MVKWELKDIQKFWKVINNVRRLIELQVLKWSSKLISFRNHLVESGQAGQQEVIYFFSLYEYRT